MDQTTKNKYVTVAYKLFTKNDKGITELVEEAPAEHPYQFITDMGITLDAFEEKVKNLNSGDKFDFTLSVDEAYGCLLYTSPSPRDKRQSRMPSSA